MKKQLLALFALLAIATTGHAMQRARSFDYNTYKYNLPADVIKNFKVGETFTITNADPKILSPRYLKDATGKDWAENTYSHYPYGGTTTPGRGTLTFTVRAIPATQPAAQRAQILPAAAAVKAAAQQQFPGQVGQWTRLPQTPGQTAGQIPATPARTGFLTSAPSATGRVAGRTGFTTRIEPIAQQTTEIPGPAGRRIQPAPVFKTADIGYEEPTPGVSILQRARQVPSAQELPTPSRASIEIPAKYPTPQRAPISPFITRTTPIGQQARTEPMVPSRAGYIAPEPGKVATMGTITTPTKTAEITKQPEALSEKGKLVAPAEAPSSAELEKSAQKLQEATKKAREAAQKLRETTREARPTYYRGFDEEPAELLPLGGFGERQRPGGSVLIDEPRAAASPLNDDFYNAITTGNAPRLFELIDAGATVNAVRAPGQAAPRSALLVAFESAPAAQRIEFMDALVEYGEADKAVLDDLLPKAVAAADAAAVKWLLEKGATRNLNAALEEARLSSTTERDASKKEKLIEIVKLLQAERK